MLRDQNHTSPHPSQLQGVNNDNKQHKQTTNSGDAKQRRRQRTKQQSSSHTGKQYIFTIFVFINFF